MRIIIHHIIKFNLLVAATIKSHPHPWSTDLPFLLLLLLRRCPPLVTYCAKEFEADINVLDVDHVEINSFLVNWSGEGRIWSQQQQRGSYISACHKQANFCLFIPEFPLTPSPSLKFPQICYLMPISCTLLLGANCGHYWTGLYRLLFSGWVVDSADRYSNLFTSLSPCSWSSALKGIYI